MAFGHQFVTDVVRVDFHEPTPVKSGADEGFAYSVAYSLLEGAADALEVPNTDLRVSGQCGCDERSSCYGCLRTYRNQFAHRGLRRGPVKEYLEAVLQAWEEGGLKKLSAGP
ncbi:MAG: hypothetical protein GX113_01080 [Actinobacteria bacterium]|nr:hypothetical protein [Actinomycetota bacterium]